MIHYEPLLSTINHRTHHHCEEQETTVQPGALGIPSADDLGDPEYRIDIDDIDGELYAL